MKNIVSISLIAVLLFNNIAYAFVSREITVTSEKIIPFSFVSDSQCLAESLSIKGLSDVKIKNMYVDNGEITANIDGNYIDVDFSDGEWSNSYKTVSRVETMDLSDIMLTNEDDKKIILTPDKQAVSIQDVTGDFSGAKILDNGDFEIMVGDYAEGNLGYDEGTIQKSQITVNINKENKNREVESETIILPHEIKGDVVAVSGDTSNVEAIYSDGNEVSVLFNNGIPVENETTINSGYTYFWIDRDENGILKKYNPNSVYSTDINKITGLGEYVDKNDFDEVGLTISNENWTDYCGIEKDGVRYIYVFDEEKGIPISFLGNLVEWNEISFDTQELNSEKFTVEFLNADVSYIPEGKLYSMGELVSGTKGWGETVPNKEWESQKTFFNELTGKLETYVKHFKFFYGPEQKKTFGGFYTYPYSCVLEYEHYKPVMLYSGSISYQYESKERIKGYSYNGWVKIEYKTRKKVSDYPPTAPFNVKYNSTSGDITWNAGSDDYTSDKELKYEVQVFDGEWKTVVKNVFLNLMFNYNVNYSDPDVRIRTIDEMEQGSEWAYASKSQIGLNGELKPYIVNPGDNIDIFATTKSLDKIQSVVAKNDEMQMYLELQKVSESTPNFVEMSYDIEVDFPEYDTDFLVLTNNMVALGNKEDVSSYGVFSSKKFKKGYIEAEIAKEITMKPNGTLIFSNLNYVSAPMDMFYYNSKFWFSSFNNAIYITNKVTGKEEKFVWLESDTYGTIVDSNSIVIPRYRLCINNFDYDKNGNSTFQYIDVDKTLLAYPLTITWETDIEGITRFNIYLNTEVVYTYQASWDKINQHVDNLNKIYMYKQMKNFNRTTYGYTNFGNAKKAIWNNIVLSLIPKYDLRNFSWLGYRVRNNEYVNPDYIDEYNANPNVRNNYRLLFCDEVISNQALKRYLDILKVKNISMTWRNETIYGDDAIEYTSMFEGNAIKIPSDTIPKTYEINIVATDIKGESEEIKLALIVEKDKEDDINKDENFEETQEPEIEDDISVVDNYFGRFFYKEEKGYLEELKKVEENSVSNGLICAGETIGLTLVTDNVEYIEIDFIGDSSVKMLDNLTKKFLIDIPEKNGKDVSNIKAQYVSFPKKIYPQYVDNNEMQIFKWFYTIPYKTIQSLESWSSLKNNTLENIDETRLFERKFEPYELVIYLNGNRKAGIHLPFDVFERWDTVLNRDITKYV